MHVIESKMLMHNVYQKAKHSIHYWRFSGNKRQEIPEKASESNRTYIDQVFTVTNPYIVQKGGFI